MNDHAMHLIKKWPVIIGIGLYLGTVACSNIKYLPAGESLYTGASVKVQDSLLSHSTRKQLRKELSALIRPLPNRTILGARLRLYCYNIAGNPKKKGSIRYWLKYKVGEPPVLESQMDVNRNIRLLQNHLENEGYFNAQVSGKMNIHKRKSSAAFSAAPGQQYLIDTVAYETDSSVLGKALAATAGKSLLKKGKRFDLDIIKAERERVDGRLKEEGYYFFNPDFLIVEADSTIGGHRVNLFVKLKKGIPDNARQPYRIKDVFIYPNYYLSTSRADTSKKNAAYYKGYYVVDRHKKYKPRLFEQSMQFNPGDWYNRTDHNQTISRLINLGLFKFVKNRFEVVQGVDSPMLNTFYYLTPFPKKSLRIEVNGLTKSNNLAGSQLTIGWRNRNTFRGGELFTVNAYGGLEVQFNSQSGSYNSYQAGIETNLSFPRFLVPFFPIDTRGGFVPKTNIQLGYDILNKKQLYTLNSFKAGFGYAWKENKWKEQQINPVSINYVQPIRVTQLYEDSAASNPALKKAIDKQFVLGSGYNFNYNGMIGNLPSNGIYFNGNVDLSGNIAGLLSGANIQHGDSVRLFGAVFAQYIRLESDFRFYRKLGDHNMWANRVLVGFGYPYGNSRELPYIKQFFVGGNNSVRAFRSRSVGPGSYKLPDDYPFLPDQSGDIKLELNTELRAKLFSIVNGAFFVDAGNVWLYNKDSTKPGGQFSKDFLKELAVGTGLGLRFDVSFLVLRLDVAFPLRDPSEPQGDRWLFHRMDFKWLGKNLVYNLAIGYPF